MDMQNRKDLTLSSNIYDKMKFWRIQKLVESVLAEWTNSTNPNLQNGRTCRVEEETCPAGLGKEEHALGGWLGQVRLG